MGGEAAKPPLALERYATLNAEIEAGEMLATVLEREAIAKETWLSAQAFWLARMAEEATGKRFETTKRYQALFAAKRKVFEARFERARKKRDREPPKPPPVEVFAGAEAELLRAPFTSLPSLSFPAPPQSAPITARDPDLGAGPVTARDVRAPTQAATPFFSTPSAVHSPPAFVSPPAAVPSPPPAPAPVALPRKQNATVSFDLPAIAKPATPFADKKEASQSPAPLARPAAPIAGAAAPKRDLSSTWGGEVPTVDMPFRKETPGRPAPAAGGERPAAPPTAPVPPANAPPAAGARANETAPIPDSMQRQLREQFAAGKRPNLGATMMADATFLQPTAATPFKQAPPAPPPPGPAKPSTSAPAHPAVAPSKPDDDDDDSPRTKMVDPDLVARVSAQATPFGARPAIASPRAATAAPSAPTAPLPPSQPEGPSSTGQKKFSINVFASLTAEIAENPSDVEAIRQRYGISESEHRAESGRWTDEFAHSAELRQRYLGIVQRYRGYIQQRKGG